MYAQAAITESTGTSLDHQFQPSQAGNSLLGLLGIHPALLPRSPMQTRTPPTVRRVPRPMPCLVDDAIARISSNHNRCRMVTDCPDIVNATSRLLAWHAAWRTIHLQLLRRRSPGICFPAAPSPCIAFLSSGRITPALACPRAEYMTALFSSPFLLLH